MELREMVDEQQGWVSALLHLWPGDKISRERTATGDSQPRAGLKRALGVVSKQAATETRFGVSGPDPHAMRLRQLSRAIEQAGEMVVITDIQGTVQYVNPTFERITGYSREEVIGQNPRILKSGKHDEAFYRGMWQTILAGEVWKGVMINQKKSGELYHEEMTIAPVFDESGAVVNFVAIKRDITERKRLETVALESQKLADLGTLAAGVAHELNSPLQVITGTSERLLRHLDGDKLEVDQLRRQLEMIHRNAWRAAEITRSLRTYAHASTQQSEPHDLNALVRDTLLLIEHKLESQGDVVVITDLAPDLPALFCDRNQIVEVLINLITNARDAMSEGGEITIRTGRDLDSRRLYLEVADTGIGIPESIRDRIFDPFFTTKPLGQGTGLGLSIVAGILRTHGGEIKVESVSGEGTTFTLFFPEQPPSADKTPSSSVRGRFTDAALPDPALEF